MSRTTITPLTPAEGSIAELVFTVEDASEVEKTYVAWRGRGLRIVLEPTDMAFGRTFMALDPDGHRLRVCAPIL